MKPDKSTWTTPLCMETFLEEQERLEEVFVLFKFTGVHSTSVVLQNGVAYLGHIVSENGITTDPAKVKRVHE